MSVIDVNHENMFEVGHCGIGNCHNYVQNEEGLWADTTLSSGQIRESVENVVNNCMGTAGCILKNTTQLEEENNA
jgi:hypothetical protein